MRRFLVRLRRMVPESFKRPLRPARDRAVASWQRHVDPGFAHRIRHYDPETMPETSICLITWNRLRMLREGLESLLATARGDDYEVIVWNNGSEDGTREYLDEIAAKHPQVRPVHSPKNVGLNAVALSVALARGYYIVELDDDVVRFPDDWLAKMLHAFKKVPKIGYVVANVVQDEFTTGEKDAPEAYKIIDYDGTIMEHGPAWGWCSMTSLDVLSKIGNFPRRRGRLNFTEDEDYVRRCIQAGYTPAILQDVVVYHASGAAMNDKYGYLESCLKKYEETSEITRKLEVAREYVQKNNAAGGEGA